MQRHLLYGSIAAAGCLILAGSATAQSVDVNVAFIQSLTSLESVRSPAGWRVGVYAPGQLGRFGIQAGYRRSSEDLGVTAAYCGAFFCEEGPFDLTGVMRTFDFGLMYAVVPSGQFPVNVGVAGSFSWQKTRLEHLNTGDVTSRSAVGPDAGIGLFVEARIPPMAFGFQPALYARYDRIGATECIADASCYGSRHVGTVGVGIAWGVR